MISKLAMKQANNCATVNLKYHKILFMLLSWRCVLLLTAGLEKRVKELYALVCRLEEEKYDWEARLGRQTEEVGSATENLL